MVQFLPGDIVGSLPLLDSALVHNGRFAGNETKGIIPTAININDLSSPSNSAFSNDLSLLTNGFELAIIHPSIVLPDPTKHTPAPPYTPWTSKDRPLLNFVSQFNLAYNAVSLPSTNVLTISCHGELLRGATSSGSAPSKNPTEKSWPPTFNAHIDQDISGEPLKSLHLSSIFQYTPLRLLNFWLPLNDAQVRPLALGDIAKIPKTSNNPPLLARWHEETFSISSDRFLITTAATDPSLWWFDSQIKPGQAYVFSTTSTPHTSFGREGGNDGGVRYSVEMRCVSVLVPEGRKLMVGAVLIAFVVVLAGRLLSQQKKENPKLNSFFRK